MYDIIGDIHGQAAMLRKLLEKMNYSSHEGIYSHPDGRKAVFIGDFINRGPEIRETIRLIRAMVDHGHAYAILGNHEVNAILFSILNKKGKHINKKWSRLRFDLGLTFREFAPYPDEWESHLNWFRHLPLFLDFGSVRVVHACWQDQNICLLKNQLNGMSKLRKSFLKEILKKSSPTAAAFWRTCKGIDFQLPDDLLIFDESGCAHRSFRSRWWENPEGMTFKELSFESRFQLPAYSIPPELNMRREAYPSNAPLVFFGHYCITDRPNILKSNICCLDSCVSRRGKLTAYRWNGELELKKENLIS